MIELQQVSKYYGKQAAVKNLSLQIAEGETVGLIGTSGCGKTTTLKMINRLEEPTSGTISIKDTSITSQNPQQLRRDIGYVIQDVGLFPHYTVAENVATVPRLAGWNKGRIDDRVEELLELVGLDIAEYGHRSPSALSGGQQQRVGLARAMAANPSIILMDEPFGALDPITKRELRTEVRRIFAEINKTIVLVTHDVVEAFEMCDRLCLLDEGETKQIGTPKELLFNPQNKFTESFFAANRFRLELLSITMTDILDITEDSELYLSPPENRAGGNNDSSDYLAANMPLYDIIELLEQASESTSVIHRKNGKILQSLGFSDLMRLFRSYKSQLRAGAGND